jgi:hypothetical protein
MNMKTHLIFTFILLLAVAERSFGMFMPPSPVPLDRMLDHLSTQQKESPKDPEVIYKLGRAHYMAFDMGLGASFTYDRDAPGNSIPGRVHLDWQIADYRKKAEVAEAGEQVEMTDRMQGNTWKVTVLSPEERREHAEKALEYLQAVRKQVPGNGLYALTLASFGQNWLESKDLHKEGAEGPLDLITVPFVLDAYEQAWRLERERDLKRDHLPVVGQRGLLAAEAAKAWIALGEGVETVDTGVKKQMEKDLKRLAKLEMRIVTPLLFHLGKTAKDPVPVNMDAQVFFDLPGDGTGGTWTWPVKGAVLMVWDPIGVGKITKGSQLFGGYTWEMFWDNGFDALKILDMNHDGRLTGNELSGLAGWKDEEPFGISDPGEVIPLQKLGVIAIELQSEDFKGSEALVWNPAGIRMENGKSIPLWDWLAVPAR